MKSHATQSALSIFGILLGSALISVFIAFFEEGRNSFSFLVDTTELGVLILYTFLGMILPLGIFLNNRNSNTLGKRLLLSLFGYIPYLLLLLLVVF